jgi:hypothetical protein
METNSNSIKWYHYIAAFLAGMFLTNVIPHYVNGLSGNPFPSPFADPPGKGLSSPTINVLWALFNMVIGYLLFRFSRINVKNKLSVIIFFIGIVFMSIMLSITFLDKMK